MTHALRMAYLQTQANDCNNWTNGFRRQSNSIFSYAFRNCSCIIDSRTTKIPITAGFNSGQEWPIQAKNKIHLQGWAAIIQRHTVHISNLEIHF